MEKIEQACGGGRIGATTEDGPAQSWELQADPPSNRLDRKGACRASYARTLRLGTITRRVDTRWRVMAIGKRLRFEILRRDNYTCRYCGATPHASALHIDHVTPVALGGTDDPANLATACEPCNTGKSSVPPDAPVVADVRQDALRWARAMQVAAELAEAEAEQVDAYFQEFYERASLIDSVSRRQHGLIEWPHDWETTLRTFRKFGLPVSLAIDAYQRTDDNHKVHYRQGWKYFCGICWSMLKEIRERASQIVLTLEDEA